MERLDGSRCAARALCLRMPAALVGRKDARLLELRQERTETRRP